MIILGNLIGGGFFGYLVDAWGIATCYFCISLLILVTALITLTTTRENVTAAPGRPLKSGRGPSYRKMGSLGSLQLEDDDDDDNPQGLASREDDEAIEEAMDGNHEEFDAFANMAATLGEGEDKDTKLDNNGIIEYRWGRLSWFWREILLRGLGATWEICMDLYRSFRHKNFRLVWFNRLLFSASFAIVVYVSFAIHRIISNSMYTDRFFDSNHLS
jgi:formate/nitrite transporter FocA (FNT family)